MADVEMSLAEFGDWCHQVGDIQAEELKGAFPDVEKTIRMGIEDLFTMEASADGEAWPERKVKGDGHQLLDDNGALRAAATGRGPGSISQVNYPAELQVGVEAAGPGGLPGARRHQYGDSPPGIRQREFIGVSDDTADVATKRVADEVMKKIDELK